MRIINWMLSIFTIFLITLSIVFFWKEKIDFTQKINDEKVGNYFTALGSIAAAISIIFLYKQILEMQADRKAPNLPDLYPGYTRFNIKEQKTLTLIPGENKPSVIPFRIEDTGIIEDKRPYVELHNIGLGAAKNITLRWKYDREIVKNIFKDTYYCHDSGHNETEHIDFIQATAKLVFQCPTFI